MKPGDDDDVCCTLCCALRCAERRDLLKLVLD